MKLYGICFYKKKWYLSSMKINSYIKYIRHIFVTYSCSIGKRKSGLQTPFDMLIKCIKNITFFVEWFIAQRFCRVVAFSLCYDCPIIQLRQTSFAFIRSINITRLVYLAAIDVCFKDDDSLTSRGLFFVFAKNPCFCWFNKWYKQ